MLLMEFIFYGTPYYLRTILECLNFIKERI